MMRAALLALALFAFAATVHAQDAADALGPCNADAAKLCADVPAGHGAKMKCLNEHEADLGPECKERIAAVKVRMKQLVEEIEKTCGEDGKKLCPDAKLGAGLLPCLVEHERDLSAPCHEWIAAHHRPGAAP
jgi:hypothetical protein